ncbi:hypothetical protein RB2080 [Rhodopirellula baltica SH 1]|uniref:Uncharacterized protein n=1 Tax=Rhodopirellula baltica (strain DSM 10527 / NCIMB 13988 / SH1) TaxID=243090 RepID=Q7UWF2_RHOBA|nr:hypothetical protein RB2080 [Rhodopirellula baltica SH 1]
MKRQFHVYMFCGTVSQWAASPQIGLSSAPTSNEPFKSIDFAGLRPL